MQNLKKKWVQILALREITPETHNIYDTIEINNGKHKYIEIVSEIAAQHMLPFGLVFYFHGRLSEGIKNKTLTKKQILENTKVVKDMYIYCSSVAIHNTTGKPIGFGGGGRYEDYFVLPNEIPMSFILCPKSDTMKNPFLLSRYEFSKLEYTIINGKADFEHDYDYTIEILMENRWIETPEDIESIIEFESGFDNFEPLRRQMFAYGRKNPFHTPHIDKNLLYPTQLNAFFEKLEKSTKGKKENLKFRLPTEKEWEYAALSGTSYKYGTDKKLSDYAHYKTNEKSITYGYLNDSGDEVTVPRPIGELEPNVWGFYDMLGNACEIVAIDREHKERVKNANRHMIETRASTDVDVKGLVDALNSDDIIFFGIICSNLS
jgi:hypothetical protein